MKRFIFCMFFCLILFAMAGVCLYGKELSNKSNICDDFGIGLSINPISSSFIPIIGNEVHKKIIVSSENLINLLVPVKVSKASRFEFELGTYNQKKYVPGAFDSELKFSKSYLRIAASWLLTHQADKNTVFYIGPRVGYSWSDQETMVWLTIGSESGYGNNRESQDALLFGFSAGGEYYIMKHFSMGLEIKVTYCSYSEPFVNNIDTDYSLYTDYENAILRTDGLIVARMYFN